MRGGFQRKAKKVVARKRGAGTEKDERVWMTPRDGAEGTEEFSPDMDGSS